jgi:radical SAM superfamily enzyme YgiQ (UPF0313 family)
MRVVLLSPYGSLINSGLRVLSATLRQAGHQTRIVFLPSANEVTSFMLFNPAEMYEPSVLEQVIDLCRDADLVGVTVMTNHFFKARQLTEALHGHLSHVPVIWGGIQATIEPEKCLQIADFVCVGEGEGALLELAQRLSEGEPAFAHIANLGYRSSSGKAVVNPPRALLRELDTLPFPDFGPDEHYVLHEGSLAPMTARLLRIYLMDASATGQPVYPMVATRGCPHRCSYCANDYYARIYDDWRHVRRRSNASLIAEIVAFRERFPFVGEVSFLDDVFVAAPTDSIEYFARSYKREIDLPFTCIVSPTTINERKLCALLDAGLVRISMGIETGSARTQELYHRPMGSEAVLQATRLLNQHKHRMLPPNYDIITDNPYENAEDKIATLALLRQVPRPYRLLMLSLVFYPGTGLYERALADGLVTDVDSAIYNRNFFQLQPTYYNLMLFCLHRQLPQRLLRLMTQPALFRLLDRPAMQPLWRLVDRLLTRLRVSRSKARLDRYRAHAAEIEDREPPSQAEKG